MSIEDFDDDHTDPSLLVPSDKTTSTDNTETRNSNDDDIEYHYIQLSLESHSEQIRFLPSDPNKNAYHISASESIITELSKWFRDTTHKVIRFVRTKDRRDHLSLRGTTLCKHSVRAGTTHPPFGIDIPNSSDKNPYRWYIPLDRINNAALGVNMCADCRSILEHIGFGRNQFDRFVADRELNPTCPECSKEVTQFTNKTYGKPVAKHGYGEDQTQCRLSKPQIKELLSGVLGVSIDATSRYSGDGYEYLNKFPKSITTATGLTGTYAQPELTMSQQMRNRPYEFAGLFELNHPDWDHTCILSFKNCKCGKIYQPALEDDN